MKSESVRFGRTLECECGAQMDFNLTASASVSYLSIEAKCPNCGKDVHIKVDTGATAGTKSGGFEFGEIGEEEAAEGQEQESAATPGTAGYGSTPDSSDDSSDPSAYKIFDEPE